MSAVCPNCKTPIPVATPARSPRHLPPSMRDQARREARGNVDRLLAIAKNPAPPVDGIQLRYRRQAYLQHLETFKVLSPEVHPGALRDEIEQTLAYAEVDRLIYEEIRTRYEGEQSVALTESNLKVATQQLELGERLAAALEEMRRHAGRQSALAQRSAPRADSTAHKEGVEVMSSERAGLQAKQSQRLRVLKAMYEISDGDERALIPYAELYERAALDPDTVDGALAFLVGEGLAERKTQGHCMILHPGVAEYEQALESPTEPTAHFPSLVVNNVFYAAVGVVQTGGDAQANVQQNFGVAPAELGRLLAELRGQIAQLTNADQREQASELANELEAEAKKEKKSELRLKAITSGLGTIPSLLTVAQAILKLWFGVP